MKLLVTGADGYIGAVLTPLLVERGHEVIGLDTGFYRSGWLYQDGKDRAPVLTRDIRRVTEAELRGFDAIVHLAELSNDPLGEQDPETTFAINHRGSVALARNAKSAGVGRFVYTSSCSVYGAGSNEAETETSAPNPRTAYARCKVLVEQDVGALADAGFSPVFLRNATAFGASPRMRFDIVLNNLAGLAWTTRCIRMTSDGQPWRPLVHILDICAAIVAVLEAPRESVHNEIFNVGDERLNYRIRDIAGIVGETFSDCAVEYGDGRSDNRSYRVSFEKIKEHLPAFRCQWDARRGAAQLRSLFSRIAMTPDTFNAAPYTRLRQLRQLIESRQLDPNLYWTGHDLH